MGSPFVANLTASQAALLKERLLDKGFELKKPPYTLFQAVGEGVSCTVYLSGKVVVQGKASKEFIEFFLEPEFLFKQGDLFETVKLPFANQAHMGSDESGKGDFVGPLCVVAFYANQEDLIKLQSMGVRDSKTLDARSIGLLAKQLRSEFTYHAVILKPEKYNELYASFKNLNKLLAMKNLKRSLNMISNHFKNHRISLKQMMSIKIEKEMKTHLELRQSKM